MKKLIFIAALTGLSACDLPTLNLPLPGLGGTKGDTETTVTRDNVTLTGPRGFCVDPQSSTRGSASAFVVFGNCAAITGAQNAPQPRVNAIVTTTVRLADPTLPKIGTSSSQLADFFESDVGQIVLSRSNDPASVDVKESGATSDGVFFLFVQDTSTGAPEGTDDTYWRAYLDVKNSVVTISVLSLDANPLTRAEGLSILRAFSNDIRTSQSNTAQTPAVSNPATTTNNVRPIERPGSENATEPQKTRKGILGRLFG